MNRQLMILVSVLCFLALAGLAATDLAWLGAGDSTAYLSPVPGGGAYISPLPTPLASQRAIRAPARIRPLP